MIRFGSVSLDHPVVRGGDWIVANTRGNAENVLLLQGASGFCLQIFSCHNGRPNYFRRRNKSVAVDERGSSGRDIIQLAADIATFFRLAAFGPWGSFQKLLGEHPDRLPGQLSGRRSLAGLIADR